MSTKDQLLYSALHGTAMRYAAERRNLDEAIEELRQIADDRNDILAEAAGITAGSWYASPATHVGYELIGAGMLILAAGGRGLPMDYDELERWTRVGYERGTRSRKGASADGQTNSQVPGSLNHQHATVPGAASQRDWAERRSGRVRLPRRAALCWFVVRRG
jgi:hypothetical protein